MRAILLVLLFVSSSFAQEPRSKHLPFGLPTGTDETNDLVFRSCYVVSSNDETKFADWVAYRLTLTELGGEVALDRNFRPDPLIDPNETLEDADYKGASAAFGYQRGHLAPLAAFRGTGYASEVNLLSNITPQKVGLNNGPWKILEEKVRLLTIKHRKVFVMCGTLYDVDSEPLPRADEDHAVPGAFWKVAIVKPKGESLKVAAFIMNQTATTSDNFVATQTTIKEIQDRTGFVLFPRLLAALVDSKDEEWVATMEELE